MSRPRHLLLAALLSAAPPLAATAQAHQIWLEREGTTVRAYFGEPVENTRERSGGLLDRIAGPRIFATDPQRGFTVERRQESLDAAVPAGTGDVRLIEDTLPPFGPAGSPTRTRAVLLAREGRTETRGVMPLEIVPTAAGGNTFTVLFDGRPLPRAEVTLVAPPRWERRLHTDAEGRVTIETPWAGRYVAEVAHVEDKPGGEGDRAYARRRYVSTISFTVDGGIPWGGR
ncbi:DUF4198 domain-containing protein [Roseomonas sp. NAR14]|uniref:DUF4198 domain-containing protein n=1 Tax=Roseomonas acroporae TaxID=2937791 RepID=A0A9X2BTU9_9PROT|nr:DUF4198 domain-containing protein [Roseomonas acroporae]MCK8785008.1 DUF4198 domain-containing protein [Roseomonas acroporae]